MRGPRRFLTVMLLMVTVVTPDHVLDSRSNVFVLCDQDPDQQAPLNSDSSAGVFVPITSLKPWRVLSLADG